MNSFDSQIEDSFIGSTLGKKVELNTKYNGRLFSAASFSFYELMKEMGNSSELEVRRFIDIYEEVKNKEEFVEQAMRFTAYSSYQAGLMFDILEKHKKELKVIQPGQLLSLHDKEGVLLVNFVTASVLNSKAIVKTENDQLYVLSMEDLFSKLLTSEDASESFPDSILPNPAKLPKKTRIKSNVSSMEAIAEKAVGVKTELEHTDNPEVAATIADDHLKEDPLYYSKLSTVEPEVKKSFEELLEPVKSSKVNSDLSTLAKGVSEKKEQGFTEDEVYFWLVLEQGVSATDAIALSKGKQLVIKTSIRSNSLDAFNEEALDMYANGSDSDAVVARMKQLGLSEEQSLSVAKQNAPAPEFPAVSQAVEIESAQSMTLGGAVKAKKYSEVQKIGEQHIEEGIGVDEDPSGISPFTLAVALQDLTMAKILYDLGADIDWKDPESKQTPLMVAADNADLPMVRWLVESGADVNAEDKWGINARDMAHTDEHYDIMRYLEDNGASKGSGWDSTEGLDELDAVADANAHKAVSSITVSKIQSSKKSLFMLKSGVSQDSQANKLAQLLYEAGYSIISLSDDGTYVNVVVSGEVDLADEKHIQGDFLDKDLSFKKVDGYTHVILKSALTQKQYEEQNYKKDQIKEGMRDRMVNPEEAYDALRQLGFGHDQSVKLTDEWGKGTFVPYAEWSKIQSTKLLLSYGQGKVLMVFKDQNLRNLYEKELSGQISDGAWENMDTDPAFWSAETTLGPSNVALILEGPVKGSFLKNEDESLMDAVGDRIKEYYGTDDEAECIKAIHRIMGMVRFPRLPKEGELEALGYNKDANSSVMNSSISSVLKQNWASVKKLIADLRDQGIKARDAVIEKLRKTFSWMTASDATEAYYQFYVVQSREGKESEVQKIVDQYDAGDISLDVLEKKLKDLGLSFDDIFEEEKLYSSKIQSASGKEKDRLVDFLNKIKEGALSENALIAAGFDLSSPANNNEETVTPKLANRLGIKITMEDVREALKEISVKSFSELIQRYLMSAGKNRGVATEGVRSSVTVQSSKKVVVYDYIKEKIDEGWSDDQIAEAMDVDFGWNRSKSQELIDMFSQLATRKLVSE